MTRRTPTDGEPYYCASCGSGFREYMACELPECQLESWDEARTRARTPKTPMMGNAMKCEACHRSNVDLEDDFCHGCKRHICQRCVIELMHFGPEAHALNVKELRAFQTKRLSDQGAEKP